MDHNHSWFVNAYNTLSMSKIENCIPLSELKVYSDCFGLIGTFEEFVNIIYAINETHNRHISNERERKHGN